MAQTRIDKIKNMDERELVYALLSEKVGSVDPKDVFSYQEVKNANGGTGKFVCVVGGKKLNENQLTNLRAEASFIKTTQIWKILTQTLSNEANLRMFKLAKNERDLDWGKAILHSVSIFETILNAVEKGVDIEAENNKLSTSIK